MGVGCIFIGMLLFLVSNKFQNDCTTSLVWQLIRFWLNGCWSFRSKVNRSGWCSCSYHHAVHLYVHLLSFCSYKTLPRIRELEIQKPSWWPSMRRTKSGSWKYAFIWKNFLFKNLIFSNSAYFNNLGFLGVFKLLFNRIVQALNEKCFILSPFVFKGYYFFL